MKRANVAFGVEGLRANSGFSMPVTGFSDQEFGGKYSQLKKSSLSRSPDSPEFTANERCRGYSSAFLAPSHDLLGKYNFELLDRMEKGGTCAEGKVESSRWRLLSI